MARDSGVVSLGVGDESRQILVAEQGGAFSCRGRIVNAQLSYREAELLRWQKNRRTLRAPPVMND
jgi:hypothetical protein